MPSTHILCMITAKRRASATWARLLPRRLAIPIAQRFAGGWIDRLTPERQPLIAGRIRDRQNSIWASMPLKSYSC